MRGGDDLQTVPDNTGYYVAGADDWVNYSVDLGETLNDVIIAFQNRGHYGNVIYVDNINVESEVSVEEKEDNAIIQVYPNPSEDYAMLSGQGWRAGAYEMRITDSEGRVVHVQKMNMIGERLEMRLNTSVYAAGWYTVHFISEQEHHQVALMIR